MGNHKQMSPCLPIISVLIRSVLIIYQPPGQIFTQFFAKWHSSATKKNCRMRKFNDRSIIGVLPPGLCRDLEDCVFLRAKLEESRGHRRKMFFFLSSKGYYSPPANSYHPSPPWRLRDPWTPVGLILTPMKIQS